MEASDIPMVAESARQYERGGTVLELSVVVPTYNEGRNPCLVADALKTVFEDRDFEVIFVDDSNDSESVSILHELEATCDFVRVEHRTDAKGLGTAVVRGFELAQGELIAVMDADMQHPPAVLLDMLVHMRQGYDIVVPSRFVPGGDDGGLSSFRKFVSWTARILGQLALKRVRAVSDPTSGFFMMRCSVIQGVKLRPIGWKILMEVLVRGHYDRIVEIPYRFQSRVAGQSNMSIQEQWNYIKHLIKLVSESPEDRRAYLFAGVGVSGVLINMLIYTMMVHLHTELWIASVLSGSLAMVSNFVLNDRLTWHDSRNGALLKRFTKYAMTSLVGIGINAGVLAVLAYKLHVDYLAANASGIVVAMVWNFYVNSFWTWSTRRRQVSVTVSAVALERSNA